ncbi:MAG: TolB family protein [Rectinemataceae bacterium]
MRIACQTRTRPGIALVLLLAATAFDAIPEPSSGFAAATVAAAISPPARTSQLDGGLVVDDFSVSADGRWISFTAFGEDIKDNIVWILPTDGSGRRRIEAPRGYKNSPVMRRGKGSRLLYLSLAGKASGDVPDGIYVLDLDGTRPRWALMLEGPFRTLAISPDGGYLAASTGNWNAAKVRSTIRVWPLDAAGRISGQPQAISPSPPGQLRRLAFASTGRSIYFECAVEDAAFPWGRPQLHVADLAPASAPRLLVADGRSPSIATAGGGDSLLFLGGSHSILSLDLATGKVREVAAIKGLTPTSLAWDPRGSRVILAAQESATTAGILAFPLSAR